MSVHVIGNRVPTPEEMGEILGLSSDRVEAVRRIMSAPVRQKKSSAGAGTIARVRRKASHKKARRSVAKR